MKVNNAWVATGMADEVLVHESNMELHGTSYEIRVFCCEDGRHFARTSFSATDIIINDGQTLTEALVKHQSILPLAVTSRILRGLSTKSRVLDSSR